MVRDRGKGVEREIAIQRGSLRRGLSWSQSGSFFPDLAYFLVRIERGCHCCNGYRLAVIAILRTHCDIGLWHHGTGEAKLTEAAFRLLDH
jgi:hypothetical protein